ncbi:MAG: alpha/beta hydrolase, partial [Microbacteriaceae bacterium]
MTTWQEDVLRTGFEMRELSLGKDSEGDVVATLVRAPAPMTRRAYLPWTSTRRVAENTDVLYVHGWSDYFFQDHVAQFWRNEGAQFYALDLRKYGRSIRPGQTLGYVDNLEIYDADIEAAIDA